MSSSDTAEGVSTPMSVISSVNWRRKERERGCIGRTKFASSVPVAACSRVRASASDERPLHLSPSVLVLLTASLEAKVLYDR
jgi:hypothetical protein